MIIFTDDFETGNLSKWDGVYNEPQMSPPDVGSVVVYRGNYAAHVHVKSMSSVYAGCYKNISQKHVNQRQYIQFTPFNNLNAGSLKFADVARLDLSDEIQATIERDVAGNTVWELQIKEQGVWSKHPSTIVAVPNQWYCVEVEAQAATVGGDGIARLYINGVLAVELLNCNFGTAPFDRVYIGLIWTEMQCEADYDVYIDDFALGDSYIGPEGAPPTMAKITYQSSPIAVNATIDGQTVPSGGQIEAPLNSSITLTVPSEATT